jgi:hypothetical protein
MIFYRKKVFNKIPYTTNDLYFEGKDIYFLSLDERICTIKYDPIASTTRVRPYPKSAPGLGAVCLSSLAEKNL